MKIKKILQNRKKKQPKECEHPLRVFLGRSEDDKWANFQCPDCDYHFSALNMDTTGLKIGYPIAWVNRGRS